MQRLAGKAALVTGAARGIGRAVARRFAEEGATVYGIDVLADELHAEMKALEQRGLRAYALPTDISSAHEVASVVERVLAEQDRVDVLANVAGIIKLKSLEATTLEDWDQILNINLRGPFLLCRAFAPGMKAAGRGSIINVSSRAGVLGFAEESAYCASKFGLEGFSRALSKELEPFNIAVNTLTPGVPTHTAMSEVTYDSEMRKIWKNPETISSAFVHLAVQTPKGIHDKYVNAWDLSEKLRSEGWER